MVDTVKWGVQKEKGGGGSEGEGWWEGGDISESFPIKTGNTAQWLAGVSLGTPVCPLSLRYTFKPNFDSKLCNFFWGKGGKIIL